MLRTMVNNKKVYRQKFTSFLVLESKTHDHKKDTFTQREIKFHADLTQANEYIFHFFKTFIVFLF